MSGEPCSFDLRVNGLIRCHMLKRFVKQRAVDTFKSCIMHHNQTRVGLSKESVGKTKNIRRAKTTCTCMSSCTASILVNEMGYAGWERRARNNTNMVVMGGDTMKGGDLLLLGCVEGRHASFITKNNGQKGTQNGCNIHIRADWQCKR